MGIPGRAPVDLAQVRANLGSLAASSPTVAVWIHGLAGLVVGSYPRCSHLSLYAADLPPRHLFSHLQHLLHHCHLFDLH